MKVLRRFIRRKSGLGSVTFLPLTEDDLWYLYNIIAVGDTVKTSTPRKIKRQAGEFGVVHVERRYLTMIVVVLDVTFQCDDRGTSLLLKTRNFQASEFVSAGQMQTIEVSPQNEITVLKECWDARTLAFVDESVAEKASSDTVVALFEDGNCGFYFLKNNFTTLHSTLKMSIPRRKGGMREVYEKRVGEFDRKLWTALCALVHEERVRLVVLAGPGVAKQRLHGKLKAIAQHETDGVLQAKVRRLLPRTVAVETSSVLKSSLEEVLRSPAVAVQLADTRAFREAQKLEEFFAVLSRNPQRAVYGPKEVRYAREQGAIKDLLITDSYIKAHNFDQRNRTAALLREVEAGGGTVFEFHEHHTSGRRLKELTGIAAILKYALALEETAGGEESEADAEEINEPSEGIQSLLNENSDGLADEEALL